jgi:hypothetical protein
MKLFDFFKNISKSLFSKYAVYTYNTKGKTFYVGCYKRRGRWYGIDRKIPDIEEELLTNSNIDSVTNKVYSDDFLWKIDFNINPALGDRIYEYCTVNNKEDAKFAIKKHKDIQNFLNNRNIKPTVEYY